MEITEKRMRMLHSDTPEGFGLFYLLVHGVPIPNHALDWVRKLYAARKRKKGIIIEAFRGSTKTTTMMTFLAYQIGLHPEKANLVIQVGDDIARDNTAAVAHIIERNPAWKIPFPHILPGKTWGANGYEVWDSRMGEHEWARKVSARKDPTFIGLGRTSRAIIGKHPDGMLIIDDIDDENTTSSDRQRVMTQKILTGTIFPTMTPETWTVGIGTPWTYNDTLAYMKSLSSFHQARTPVMDEEGVPIWPQEFPTEVIEEKRVLSGQLEFARMFMLDLEAASGINLKKEWLHEYPKADINDTWPVVIGVDYASTADKMRDRDRDYFAVAVGRLIPGGGCVLVDGFRGRVSQGEGEQMLRSWGAAYPTCSLIVIEAVGKGEEFYNLMLRRSRLPIFPATTGGKSKGNRFEKQMAPLFQFSRVWISGEENEFLTLFKNEWAQWPLGEYDDTLDATYYMILGATQLGNLAPPAEERKIEPWFAPRKKQKDPWALLGKYG